MYENTYTVHHIFRFDLIRIKILRFLFHSRLFFAYIIFPIFCTLQN
jgi:hypothetical protein